MFNKYNSVKALKTLIKLAAVMLTSPATVAVASNLYSAPITRVVVSVAALVLIGISPITGDVMQKKPSWVLLGFLIRLLARLGWPPPGPGRITVLLCLLLPDRFHIRYQTGLIVNSDEVVLVTIVTPDFQLVVSNRIYTIATLLI